MKYALPSARIDEFKELLKTFPTPVIKIKICPMYEIWSRFPPLSASPFWCVTKYRFPHRVSMRKKDLIIILDELRTGRLVTKLKGQKDQKG